MEKLIIVTAPSGAGKTTVVRHLLDTFDSLAFSVSATTRSKRENEVEGRDYYFMDAGKFRALIKENAFLEWEEVYENQYYGTLKQEAERLWAAGKHIIFDIDVQGALHLKTIFPDRTLTVFVKPPQKEALVERLTKRKSESEESLQKRITKAEFELTFEEKFDIVLVNDDLTTTFREAEWIINKYVI